MRARGRQQLYAAEAETDRRLCNIPGGGAAVKGAGARGGESDTKLVAFVVMRRSACATAPRADRGWVLLCAGPRAATTTQLASSGRAEHRRPVSASGLQRLGTRR